MFVNNLSPTIVKIGFLQIRWYGLVYALGFLITYLYLKKHEQELGLKNKLEVFLLYLFFGLLIGARVGHLLYNVPYYSKHLTQVFAFWLGGMSFYGGLAGVVIVGLLFCKKHNLDFFLLADKLSIIAALFLGFGRIANFLNSELVGLPTSKPWCVVFVNVDNLCRHPVQIYEALKNFFIFSTLLVIDGLKLKGKVKLVKGALFALFLTMYGLLRFLTNFYRDEPLHYGLNTGQWLGIALFIIGIALWVKLHARAKNNP